MMKCKSCGCDLSPEEKDEVLTATIEGVGITTGICQDCIDSDCEDSDDQYCRICDEPNGNHELNCLDNHSPFAQLLRDGFD